MRSRICHPDGKKNLLGNNIAVDPHSEKARRCHVDRSGDILFAVVQIL